MEYFQPMDRDAVILEFRQTVDELLKSKTIDPFEITEEEAKKTAYEKYISMSDKRYHQELKDLDNRGDQNGKNRLDLDMQHIASSELDKKLKPIYQSREEYKELAPILGAKLKGHAHNFAQLALSLGTAELDNNENMAKQIKSTKIYQEASNAYIKTELRQLVGTLGIEDLETTYQSVLTGTEPLSEKISQLEGIKQRLDIVKPHLEKSFENLLVESGLHVLKGSLFDTLAPGTGIDPYYVLDTHGKLKEDFNNAGDYAQTSVGAAFREFYEETFETVTETPGILSRFLNYATSGRLGSSQPTMRRIAHKRTDVGELGRRIVAKHKKQSMALKYNPEYNISLEDVALYGCGMAAMENGLDAIANAWGRISALDSGSDMSAIADAYSSAVKLGKELNYDAESWTSLNSKAEFARMDNYINQEAGILYSAYDWLTGAVDSVFKSRTLDRGKTERLKVNMTDWNIHKTAIKPKKFAPIVTLTAAAGGAVALYALFHDLLSEKPLKEKTRQDAVFHPWEFIVDLGAALTAIFGVKALEGAKA